MKTYAIGDIHGTHKALVQCLKRAGFDAQNDRLIVLGDVCDGYPEVDRCIDELLKIRHCDFIIGNHDMWALDWAERGAAPSVWLTQGGEATVKSYGGGPMPPEHAAFLKNGKHWIESDNRLFVHAGFDPEAEIADQDPEVLAWTRDLVVAAQETARLEPDYKFSAYDEIYVGHTTTMWLARRAGNSPASEEAMTPLFMCNVIDLDTGAGWGGKLTVMDIESHDYWQSEPTVELYGYLGR